MPPSSGPELRIHPPFLGEEREELAAFLRSAGLEPEPGMAYTVACLEGGRIAAVGSLSGRVIRGLAVSPERQGEGLAATVVSALEAEAGARGLVRLLVYTSPDKQAIFSSLGYRLIAESGEDAVLLEKGGGIESWCAELSRALPRPPTGFEAPPTGVEAAPTAALVMNCNPFTLGHRHLVEAAARRASRVALFVVSEEASSFPYEVRLRLVREGTADLQKVTVIPGTDYLISRATFPTYFLKDRAGAAAAIHARLDLDLFARHVAPAVGASLRLVAEEPYSEVTRLYNRIMQEVLPPRGIAVEVIPRLEAGGQAVSASTVRRLIREGSLGDIRGLVPECTWAYLNSPEAKDVLERVRATEGRH
ncbi:MAG TPA: GNAT family N-acetyltransferase [Rectinemataceae bacterium]|nr:GNAT family N-acetyltransferase [Rectinemataceae bacterium]